MASTSTIGPSSLNFEANIEEDFRENQPLGEGSFTVGTFSAESQNVSADNIIYTNLTITRGSNGESVPDGAFDILSGSDQLTCNTSFNFRLDNQTNASLLGSTQEPDPNANKFYGEFTAYDGEYTTQSFEFELKNVKPLITINSGNEMPFSLQGASDGDVAASGGIFNGCSNELLNMHDMAVEIVSSITWQNGMPVFSIQQVGDTDNLYQVNFNTYGDDANTVLWLKDQYGGENDIMNLEVKVTDAGGETDTAIIQFSFDESFLEVWVMSPMVNAIGDTSGTGVFTQNSYPSSTPICELGMDATTVDQFGQYLTPGWVKVWVAKGDATTAPHNVTTFVPPSSITAENTDGVPSPNLLTISPQNTITGVQLYKNNIVYQNSTGTTTYGASMDSNAIPLKYFKTHVIDDSQGISNWPSKIWQHFEIDINGKIGEIEECETS